MLDRQDEKLKNDERLRLAKEKERADQQAKLNADRLQWEQKLNESKSQNEKIQTQLNSAKQQTQTIIHQPPVYHYVPPYDYRYYRWWYP